MNHKINLLKEKIHCKRLNLFIGTKSKPVIALCIYILTRSQAYLLVRVNRFITIEEDNVLHHNVAILTAKQFMYFTRECPTAHLRIRAGTNSLNIHTDDSYVHNSYESQI